LEEGREVVETSLPALLTVVKDINQPRYPTFMGIRRATRMEIPTWTADDLCEADLDRCGLKGSPTQVVRVFSPPRREGTVDLIEADSLDEAAGILADKLLAEKVL
jgi:electron transfer flavoprotein alpha/beta subunit